MKIGRICHILVNKIIKFNYNSRDYISPCLTSVILVLKEDERVFRMALSNINQVFIFIPTNFRNFIAGGII